jgi:hypothetical protein
MENPLTMAAVLVGMGAIGGYLYGSSVSTDAIAGSPLARSVLNSEWQTTDGGTRWRITDLRKGCEYQVSPEDEALIKKYLPTPP